MLLLLLVLTHSASRSKVGLGYSMMPFLFVDYRAPLPRQTTHRQPRAFMMCYSGCSCRCSAAALVLLLCRPYYRAVLLLLLCLQNVFAADPRDNGYYASRPLSGIRLCISKLKDGSIPWEAVLVRSRICYSLRVSEEVS